jgi:hypothetical protein
LVLVDWTEDKPAKQAMRIGFAVDCGDYNPRYPSTPMLTLSTLKGVVEDTSIPDSSPLFKFVKNDLDYTKKTHVVSGQFIWVPPPGNGKWVFLDDSHHFYPTGGFFTEGYLNMVVRFTTIS